MSDERPRTAHRAPVSARSAPSAPVVAPADWQDRIDAFWSALDDAQPQTMIARMRALVAELPDGDARGPFELGGVFDSLGMEEVAAAHYRRALELGLDEERTARLAIQHGSTLRNLGRVDEAIEVLAHAPDHPSIGDARAVFLALALHEAGRSGEAVRVLIDAIEPTLPRYRRSVRAYAAELPTPPTPTPGASVGSTP